MTDEVERIAPRLPSSETRRSSGEVGRRRGVKIAKISDVQTAKKEPKKWVRVANLDFRITVLQALRAMKGGYDHANSLHNTPPLPSAMYR
jgi:hypothetical protein